MAITTKTQDSLVAGQVTAMQASYNGLLNFTLGSILLVFAQAVAAVGLWVQSIVTQLAQIARAATSNGPDLDSFVRDFGLTRLQPLPAVGNVTFSRNSTQMQVVVAIGDVVETGDGTQQFAVAVNTANPAYSAQLGGYVMAAGVGSVIVPVQAVTAGSAGNVAAGTVTTITGAIPGVDFVTNAAPMTSGADQETDPALRLRFTAFFLSLAQGTPAAVRFAISQVQQNLDIELVENATPSGNFQAGYFFVVIDDGSGTPPQTLLIAVANAISTARPLTAQWSVLPPVLVPIAVSMTIVGGNPATVQAAISAYISSAGLGGSVEFTKLSQVAFNADPNVTNVTGVLLNGGQADVTCTQRQRPSVASITVTPASAG